jgi:CheY-like chemotaxis protein
MLRAARARPDLILLDLMMPVMNGWQFRDAQRGDPTIASIPVVLVTASRDVEARSAAVGVAGVLYKPVELHSLLAVVSRCSA